MLHLVTSCYLVASLVAVVSLAHVAVIVVLVIVVHEIWVDFELTNLAVFCC